MFGHLVDVLRKLVQPIDADVQVVEVFYLPLWYQMVIVIGYLITDVEQEPQVFFY